MRSSTLHRLVSQDAVSFSLVNAASNGVCWRRKRRIQFCLAVLQDVTAAPEAAKNMGAWQRNPKACGMAAEQWRWTDEDGVQRLLSTSELRAALADGRLDKETLVWRRGMASWVPAGDVEELLEPEGTAGGKSARGGGRKGKPRVPRVRGRARNKALQQASVPPSAGMIVSSTAAPKLPRVPDFSKPDGGWKEGAASRDGEETVTVLKTEADEKTQTRDPSEHASSNRQRLADRKRNSTRPPPPPRGGPRKPSALSTVVLQASGPAGAAPGAAASESLTGDGKVRIDPAMAALVAPAASDARRGSSVPPAPFFDHEEETMTEQFVPSVDAPQHPQPGGRGETRPFPQVADQRTAVAEGAANGDVMGPAIPRAPAIPRDMMQYTQRPPNPNDAGAMERWLAELTGFSARQAKLATYSGAVLLLFVFAFGVGRCSVGGEPSSLRAEVRWAGRPLEALPQRMDGDRPCLMSLAPARWGPRAAQSVPIELTPTADGRLAVGFGETALLPGGVIVDAQSGEIGERATLDEQAGPIERVVPLPAARELRYAASLRSTSEIRGAVHVAQAPSFLVGFGSKALVRADAAGEPATELWPLENDSRADALRLRLVEDIGVVVVYRHDQRIWYGLLDEEGKVVAKARPIEGTVGKVGKPTATVNRGRLVVAFAQKADADSPIEIHWAKGKLGKPLGPAKRIEIPAGGPKGNAMAPAMASLSGGRWVLGWTEGCPSACTMRVQTYDARFRAIGNALRVSPATGRFGQGVVGVVGESAAVGFLLDTGGSYELWGTVLQCQ